MLGSNFHVAIVEPDFEGDVRVAFGESRDGRQQQVLAEGHRHVDAELALRAIAREAQLVIGCVDLRQDAFAVFEVHRALGRYRHLARGAVEEAGAEVFFELRHVAARHGARQVEGVCGAHERAQFRHPGENPHALQLVHGRRSYRGLSSRARQ